MFVGSEALVGGIYDELDEKKANDSYMVLGTVRICGVVSL